jgi:hypothetical protein
MIQRLDYLTIINIQLLQITQQIALSTRIEYIRTTQHMKNSVERICMPSPSIEHFVEAIKQT